MLRGPFLIADRRVRDGKLTFGVLKKLVSFEQDFQPAVAEKTVSATFDFRDSFDGRHVTLQQFGSGDIIVFS